MKIRKFVLIGAQLFLMLAVLPVHAEINLASSPIQGVKQTIKKPIVPHNNAVVQKPIMIKGIKPKRVQACPKLFAKGLRIVRVAPQPVRSGEPTYRFILDGTIANRGAAGLATAGFNVTQSVQGKPGKRIAMKLFRQQVRTQQALDVNRDLHVTIQSDGLSRTQASHTVFKLNVTNLRNDQGACGEYNATVSTIGATEVSRALPAQIRGVSQQAGSLPSAGKPQAGAGFASNISPPKKLLKAKSPATGLKQPILSTPHASLPVLKKMQPLVPGKQASGTARPTFALLPPGAKPITGHGGFAPKVSTKVVGLNKPLVDAAGKSLLPPAETGSRHTLHDGPTAPVGGFAVTPAFVAVEPVTGPGASSLIPAQIKLTLDHLIRLETGGRIPMENNRSTETIPQHTRIMAYLRLENLGVESTNVSVTLSASGYPPSRSVSVAPGGAGQLVTLSFLSDETYGEILDAAGGPIFIAQFKLVTPDGAGHDFSDGNNRDNKVSVNLKIESAASLYIQNISNVELSMEYSPTTKADRRMLRTHLKSLSSVRAHAIVTIFNSGTRASTPQNLRVTLESTQSASRPPDNQPHRTFTFAMGSGNGEANGMQQINIAVPSIPGNSSVNKDVYFYRLYHDIWQGDYHYRVLGFMKHRYYVLNAGAFACGQYGYGSAFKITAGLPASRVNVYVTGSFNRTQDSRQCNAAIDGSLVSVP